MAPAGPRPAPLMLNFGLIYLPQSASAQGATYNEWQLCCKAHTCACAGAFGSGSSALRVCEVRLKPLSASLLGSSLPVVQCRAPLSSAATIRTELAVRAAATARTWLPAMRWVEVRLASPATSSQAVRLPSAVQRTTVICPSCTTACCLEPKSWKVAYCSTATIFGRKVVISSVRLYRQAAVLA